MTQCNTLLYVRLTNSKINELISRIKNGTEINLNLSSNVIGNSNDETNFPHPLLLPNTQLPSSGKAFANGFSANIE